MLWVSASLDRVKEFGRAGEPAGAWTGVEILDRTRELPGPVSSEGSGAVRGPVIWACACVVVSEENVEHFFERVPISCLKKTSQLGWRLVNPKIETKLQQYERKSVSGNKNSDKDTRIADAKRGCWEKVSKEQYGQKLALDNKEMSSIGNRARSSNFGVVIARQPIFNVSDTSRSTSRLTS